MCTAFTYIQQLHVFSFMQPSFSPIIANSVSQVLLLRSCILLLIMQFSIISQYLLVCFVSFRNLSKETASQGNVCWPTFLYVFLAYKIYFT